MKRLSSAYFYSGLSGLQLNIPRYLYPEPFQNASRLSFYSSLFNSIEINSSFYKIPRTKTVAKWASMVGKDFKFTFKLWKEITHCKCFDFNEKDVELFFTSINEVGKKRGCLLIQFPPKLGNEHIGQLDKLLSCIKEHNTLNWKIAVEFRNKTWYNDPTTRLLKLHKAAIVIHDIPKSATPMIPESKILYIRFHGPTGNYRDSYSDEFLSEYATHVKEWLSQEKEIYMYFNNTMGDAFNNLQSINRFTLEATR